ncbi:hypothetical protein HYU40_01635 [Candidatus Woesearchaeota archaeon]|nr:hypothetical protein [Candidatus Woesearchaeota archaeon]
MAESESVGKGEGFALSLELGDLAKYGTIAVGSFVITALLGILARNLLKSNIVLTLMLAFVVFTSAFFAMHFAKTHVRKYAKKYGWLVIPSALAAIFAISSVKPLVFVVLFIIHALACFFLRTLKNTARLGIELIMLITVLGSFVYGAKAGALLGATAMLMDYALSARFSYFVPVTTAAYVLIGLFAGAFSSFGITAVGISAAIIYNLATSFIIVGA